MNSFRRGVFAWAFLRISADFPRSPNPKHTPHLGRVFTGGICLGISADFFAVSNRGPRPLLGRGVPTRYWEGTPMQRVKVILKSTISMT